MRRFTFRLEAVLRQREIIEGQRENEFAAAQGQVAAIEARIVVCRDEIRRTVLDRPDGSGGAAFDPAGIVNRERYLETLQSAIWQLERHTEAARIVAEEARLRLVAARQAREAVSHLRDKELSEHTALGLKREQESLDEIAGQRYIRQQPVPKS